MIDALKHRALALIQRVLRVCFAFAARIFRSFQSESKHTHVFRMNSLKSIRKSAKSDVTMEVGITAPENHAALTWTPKALRTADP